MEAHATNPRLTLDTLPAEILENILLYSTNLSLPKAHPLIGLKLSQKATLIRLFIWAFHETWDGWFGFPTAKTLLGPHINVHGKEQTTVDGDHDLQTALLRQPWATTDFILQAQQTWAESYGRGRWYQHSLPWNEEPIDLKHSHHGGHCHFDSRKCFEVDYQQALKWAPFQSSSYPWGYQDVHPKAQAPTDLLTGPWNDEQLRRLFWLTRGGLMGFNARGDNAPSWEIKLQFLRNAILDVSEVNVLAVNCLMCNNVYQDIPRDILMKEKENISTRLQWGDDTDNGRQILEQVRDSMDMVLQYSR
ncbi:hypothetical protein N3K66_000572 [Trichothecium roseum]|uniref:Uncharacterized protein n=1 Tax=Trichothecium roseum TaxID=47278 RepID=A0ACC0VF08_9HYPO|nr:hypothetical protein N3K66_000572 [Trichothecium roseum]